MPLSDLEIKKAKSKEKPYKLSDSAGLYVEIAASGSKLWRMKYRYAGKEKRLSFGAYPAVTLAQARDYRDQARKLLENKIDPAEIKRTEKLQREIVSSNSFDAIARDWFDRHLTKKAESTKNRIISRMERFVFPYIGKRPVTE